MGAVATPLRPIETPEHPRPPRRIRSRKLFEPELVREALKQSFIMLRPDIQWSNPVMFVVEIGAVLTLLFILQALVSTSVSQVPITYFIALDFWLFLTVLFANFATALAEARGKAQAQSLRKTRSETPAYRLKAGGTVEEVLSTDLKPGDRVVITAGQVIPSDGEVVEGIASVDESAITGESAPVIREAGGDRSGVTGGTRVISDRIVVKITALPGQAFLDRMIALVEGAVRQKTPNEIALTLVLSGLTLAFLIVVIPIWPMAWNAEQYMMGYLNLSAPLKSLGTDVPTLVALLVCLIPTTIGALLAAIGIAGMDRALQANIIAKSGKSVEIAGDIDTVLLDKTGTITVGNRRATDFVAMTGYSQLRLALLAALASAADETPEGKSIVTAAQAIGVISKDLSAPTDAQFIPFSAQSRMSGVDFPDGRCIRKGAPDAVVAFVQQRDGVIPAALQQSVDAIASKGATPLVVAENSKIAGVLALEDILKPGMGERFERLRKMGLRTVMITGDNPPIKAGSSQLSLSQAAAEALLRYGWPGNVRELHNALERAATLARSRTIALADLPDSVRQPLSVGFVPTAHGASLKDFEREHILRVLGESPTLERAAATLGINVTTLWRKRRHYRIA